MLEISAPGSQKDQEFKGSLRVGVVVVEVSLEVIPGSAKLCLTHPPLHPQLLTLFFFFFNSSALLVK